jgi:basic membrane protein A
LEILMLDDVNHGGSMKMKKMTSFGLALVLMFSLLLAACGGGEKTNEGQNGNAGGEAPAADQLKIGMVTDVGGVNDNSFNQSAWEGLQKAEADLGVSADVQESKSDADYIPNLNRFVKDGYHLTWGIGFLMADAIKEVATKNADTKLGIIDSNLGGEIPANVAAVTFKEHEGSFLMGVIAGSTTKTNKIGFVGGVKFALIEKFEYGFKAGVKSVNPNAEVVVNYVGDFTKPDQGKVVAATMYDSGVDIIYHASGATGDGVFAEAKERGNVWVIGVDRDQSYLAPDQTLSSMMKRVDVAVYTVTEQLKNGSFPGGTATELGLVDNGVGIAPTSDKHVSKEILDKVEEYKQKIIAGEIKVPQTDAEFQQFQ